jgi:hypothetical protein
MQVLGELLEKNQFKWFQMILLDKSVFEIKINKSETFISSVWCDLVLFIFEMRAVLVLIMIELLSQSSLSYTSSEASTRTINRFYWTS